MDFVNFISQAQVRRVPFIIYGAGNTAETLLLILKKMYANLNILGCAVTECSEKRELLGYRVRNIEEYSAYVNEAVVLCAVVDKYFFEIAEVLENIGFRKVISMTFESSNWEDLRELYLKRLYKDKNKRYPFLFWDLNKRRSAVESQGIPEVYMACCHVDKPLREKMLPQDTDFLIPIQVGKSLTDESIADIHDDVGDNISVKNKAYSELTALYWLWKNARSKWIGLCHYRRHFALNADEVSRIPAMPVDIVLTVPILNFPSIEDVYYRDHEKRDWQDMLEVLNEMYPDYGKKADTYFKGVSYCGYNMFIARKSIIDEYCAWLFPLLESIEKRHSCHENVYQGRYIGFLAERLFSLYFLSGINSYRIRFAHKRFYM